MGCEPKFGENFLARTNAWRHILALHSSQQRVFRHMNNAIAILGNDDDVVSGLLQELAPPTLPADGCSSRVGLLTRPPVLGRPGTHQPGDHDVHAPRPRVLLQGMLHTPRQRLTPPIVSLGGPAYALVTSSRQQTWSLAFLPVDVSLPDNGVLFLDELPEFRRHGLEVLSQQLEDGVVTIARG